MFYSWGGILLKMVLLKLSEWRKKILWRNEYEQGVNLIFPFKFQEEPIEYQYNFIELLNNLFRVGWE